MWLRGGRMLQTGGRVSIQFPSQENSWNVRETERRHVAGEVSDLEEEKEMKSEKF